MTLCIAAQCVRSEADQSQLIALCADRKVVQGNTSAETGSKVKWPVPGHWMAMLAGNVSHSTELIEIYRHCLIEGGIPAESNILEKLRIGLSTYQHRRAEQHVKCRIAMPYEYFLENGKSNLPEGLFFEMQDWIANPPDEERFDLIVAGFTESRSRIFSVSSSDGVSEETDDYLCRTAFLCKARHTVGSAVNHRSTFYLSSPDRR